MTKSTQKFSSFSSGVISQRMLGNTHLKAYEAALSDALNFIIGLYGYATARPGTKYVYGAKSNSVKSYLIPFKYDNETSYMLEFTTNTIRFFKDQAVILNLGSPYEVTTTYAVADLPNLRYTQSYDTIYLVCPGYPPKQLQRITDTNWTFGNIAFDEPAWLDENQTTTTLAFTAVTGTGVTCTASAATFVSTDVGRHIRFKAGEDDTDAVLYDAPGSSQIYFEIPFFPKTSADVEVFRIEDTGAATQLTYNAGVLGADEFKITAQKIEIAAALTGEKLLVQRKNTGSGKWGYALITAYTSSTQVTVTVINELGGTNASVMWRLGAWSDTTGYPEAIGFIGQRLWFGNTNSAPNRLWGSAIQDFLNFAPDNDLKKGDVSDDTSIDVTIDGINIINWLSPTNVMLVGGEGLKSIGKGGALITPSTISVLPEEATVTKNIAPVTTKNDTIFSDRQGKFLYAAGFNFQNDAYTTTQLNVLSDQLFESSQISKIEFTQNPTPIVWTLRDDGKLVATTYNKEFGINASVLQSIGGTSVEVESIAAIPRGAESELWMVVKRTINGSTKRYIEVLSPHFYLDDKTSSIFFDSALTYSGVSATTITGLNHLEGETVSVIGNGAVQTDKVVSGGSITLDSAVTTATIGLDYTRYITTVPLDSGKMSGPAKGSIMRAKEVIVDFFETDGTYIQINDEESQEINFRNSTLIGSEANELFTGIKTIPVFNQHAKELTVTLLQTYGLPCTVRSIAIKVDISEN